MTTRTCLAGSGVSLMKITRVLAVVWLAAVVKPVPAVAQPVADVTRTVEITVERFRFVPSQIEVREGESVRLKIRSVDATHGLAIPTLGIEQQIPAGREVEVEFVADTPGHHPFQCSVFCGSGHGRMTGSVTVLPVSAPGETTGGSVETTSAGVDAVEPDYSLIALPSTRTLPTNRFAFRLTHRFSRPLDGGAGHGNLIEDFFGFDSPALIGLELRYGLAPGLQVGVHRNNSRNLQLFGRYSVLRVAAHGAVDAFVSVEGLDNFRDHYSTTIGAVVSGRVADRLAVYVEPMWSSNTNKPGLLHRQLDPFVTSDEHTFVLGVAARLNLLDSVAVTGEFLPRLAGFDQGDDYVAFAVEKVVGGHVFQLNISNSIGVTPAQLAQGGDTSDWFIGFNIARQFF